MKDYYRIDSKLKATTGVDYLIPHKNNKNKKQSVRVIIHGAYKPGDIEKDRVKPTFISRKEHDLLLKPQGNSSSMFAFLIEEWKKISTINDPHHGIMVTECEFTDLPDGDQKRYDLEAYDKRIASEKRRAYVKAEA